MQVRTRQVHSGLLLLAAGIVSPCFPAGADSCISVTGDRLLASDLAKAVPVFGRLSPDERIGFAPLPGARRLMSRQEVVRLAKRYSLPEDSVSSACFALEAKPLSPESIAAALREILPEGKGEISVVDFSRQPAPSGDLVFPQENLHRVPDRGDGSLLYRGFVRYGQRSWPIWARVKLRTAGTRVVAASDLKQGEPISAAQLRVEQSGDWLPGGSAALTEIAQAAGQMPRRTVKAGTALQAAMLTSPKDIQMGDVVEVEAHSGAARLRFTARALAGGRRGDAVLMLNHHSGARFKGLIEGPGRASVTVPAVDLKRCERICGK
jgi:flagella basal body P-ring formation protein FlgA